MCGCDVVDMTHHKPSKAVHGPSILQGESLRPNIKIASCILYQDAEVVALHKPHGLPSTGHDLSDPNCAQWLLADYLRRPVWAIHQLDRQTSGVLLFVRKKSLVDPWHQRLKPPTGQKTYWAICHGVPVWDCLEIDAPLGWDGDKYGVTPSGKPARTMAKVLCSSPDRKFSVVSLALFTGRTHQIRVHLTHVGHPLVGEAYYHVCDLHPRHALHAARVQFFDGRAPEEFVAPLPEDLVGLAARLGVGEGL